MHRNRPKRKHLKLIRVLTSEENLGWEVVVTLSECFSQWKLYSISIFEFLVFT